MGKNDELIDFVKKTTEAITVISDNTRQLTETTGAIKEMLSQQSTSNAKGFEALIGKMDGLTTMFKFVIAPLVAGILALVGIKMIFNL